MKPGEWYKAAQLLDEAEGEGISADALHRAKAKLGIRKPAHLKKEGGVWWWRLPAK